MRNVAPTNRVVIDLGGDVRTLEFDGPTAARIETLELLPSAKPVLLQEGKRTVYAYRLRIQSSSGFNPRAAENARRKNPVNEFYRGVAMSFLGSREDLDRDLFGVEWGPCQLPEEVAVGQIFTVPVQLTNTSDQVWPARGPTRVNLSYRWLDSEDRPLSIEGRRTQFARDVAPGASLQVEAAIQAPGEPGSVWLELDLVRERVSWFSKKRYSEPCRGRIEVATGQATGYSPEP